HQCEFAAVAEPCARSSINESDSQLTDSKAMSLKLLFTKWMLKMQLSHMASNDCTTLVVYHFIYKHQLTHGSDSRFAACFDLIKLLAACLCYEITALSFSTM